MVTPAIVQKGTGFIYTNTGTVYLIRYSVSTDLGWLNRDRQDLADVDHIVGYLIESLQTRQPHVIALRDLG
jgi:hypothetical protein